MMASLLTLPLELLRQIVQETIPADFEATALSCKTLFAASTPFQAKYATRRKQFRNFAFSRKIERKDEEVADETDLGEEDWDEITQETGIRIRTTRDLLEQIALDHSVAQYIQSIDLRGGGAEAESDEEDEEILDSLQVEVPETLKDLVRTSPFIEAVGGDPEDWIGQIQHCAVDADIFLLTLLPQVRKVALHPRWDRLWRSSSEANDERRWQVLKLITHRANHSEEFPDAPLSKLSVVQPSRDIGYEEKSPLTPFVPLLAINSVSEVSLSSCVFKDDGYTGIAFDPLVENYSTNLRKLSITSSVAGPEELSQLLSRIPNLEIFDYSHETKWHGCGHVWNIGAFLDTVLDTCAEKLKELSVTVVSNYGGLGPTLVDMTRFQKLTVLDMDVEMLCGPQYDPSMRFLDFDDDLVGDPAWPKLVDILPASIERFSLYLTSFSGDHIKCITHLIEGLSDNRATKLPRLDKLSLFVCMEPCPKIPDMALKALNAAKRSGFSIMKNASTPLL
ncbi:hypothetical protein ASPWEDRAFT_716351 [Aspergillus wentii DTO 134E9]|uniref:F-box domain-containing protein n=1 Tax=Aspergillus wentii DTO 134E9 TaxID=1073089 RepID=A0A1L9R6F6_ASPWE|nr:uncharacterized protein ASPWEDRAFT_716351 [Aspergillus wentii DTO 134E9]KAI9926830.1 hypothetical protein MW887_003927 [Aspergillus wentii]OJJ30501.1 hypothetical protein ASPWEDRAFT_716351 [Aspergillus wentii DTO 134E9]